jgi:hypothetical protein
MPRRSRMAILWAWNAMNSDREMDPSWFASMRANIPSGEGRRPPSMRSPRPWTSPRAFHSWFGRILSWAEAATGSEDAHAMHATRPMRMSNLSDIDCSPCSNAVLGVAVIIGDRCCVGVSAQDLNRRKK